MQAKLFKILLIILAVLGSLLLPKIPLSSAVNQILSQEFEFPLAPGGTEGAGAHFEVKDSEYLNITLKSTEEIKIVLESIPRMISLSIGPTLIETTSTFLILEGLEPDKTYYKYQDSHKNGAVLVSDENGNYGWEQDLIQPHHIWFQEERGTIYIPGDCSKYGTWDEETLTCALTKDLTEGIEITQNDITLNCAEHSLSGNGSSYGVYLNKKINVNIGNCLLANFSRGVGLFYSSGNSIFKNNITNNSDGIYIYSHYSDIYTGNSVIENKITNNRGYGMDLLYVKKLRIEGNYIADNSQGISLFGSSNVIIENNITNNGDGFVILGGGGSNTLKSNILDNNKSYNFGVLGISILDFFNDIDISNKIDARPIYYLTFQRDLRINPSTFPDIGYLALIESDNITIEELELKKNFEGLLLAGVTNSQIINNRITENFNGIWSFNSSNNKVSGNIIINNRLGGLVFINSSDNNIIEKNMINLSWYGIELMNSSFNEIIGNTINNGGLKGISLYRSNKNNITKNTTANSDTGIYFSHSIENLIYHNNFIDNEIQALSLESNNLLNDDYPSGGNYWSDYTGIDEKSGEKQDQPGSDSIGDTPYTFAGGQDRYPFMRENGWEAPPEPEKWSFAIITDLHIGFDIPDYDSYSYDDTSSGQDYYLSKRLEAVINRINELKKTYNIKFVSVLGDISDTAEYSELIKARDILNKLNDPNGDGDLSDGIPYIPLIGNHDVWPYTQKEGIDPDERGEENHATISPIADGDEYFERIFWCSPYVIWRPVQESRDDCLKNNTNLQKIQETFGDTWQRQEELADYRYDNIFLQNYAFSYKGLNFISLDYVETDRKKEPGWYPTYARIIQTQPITNTWLESNIKEPSILFSHHPSKQWGIKWGTIEKPFPLPSEAYFSFAGHVHYPTTNDNIEKLGSIITEAVKEEYSDVIRIIQVKDTENPTKEDIDYSKIEGIPEETAPDDIKRPDPYIIYSPKNPDFDTNITFTIRDEIKEGQISSCNWDFGDETSETSFAEKCEISHKYLSTIYPFCEDFKAKATVKYQDNTERLTQEKTIRICPKFELKFPPNILPMSIFGEQIVSENTPQSVIPTKMIGSKKMPIGILNINFGKVGGN